MIFAIHTVFILKENILFLDEWIYYHILLGFNKFYLYDNSKVMKSGGCHKNCKCFKAGKVNKYGTNYDELVNMTDTQMYEYLNKICEKYKCIEIIEWSPKDGQGNILHNQVEAHNHCLKLMKMLQIEWCANIDMDEYIVIKYFDNIGEYISSLPPNITNIKLSQICFDSRFNNLDKLVTDIIDAAIKPLPRGHGCKNIYKIKNTVSATVHDIEIDNKKLHKSYKPPIKEICFNHYKMKNDNYKHVDNINVNIKNQLRLLKSQPEPEPSE